MFVSSVDNKCFTKQQHKSNSHGVKLKFAIEFTLGCFLFDHHQRFDDPVESRVNKQTEPKNIRRLR